MHNQDLFTEEKTLHVKMNGKWALVTGGALRIGRAICLALAEQGCNVIVHCNRSQAEADQLVTELRGQGVEFERIAADLAHADECGRLMSEAWQTAHGELFFLVNNAAVFGKDAFRECDEDALMRQLRPNLIAPFLLMVQFAGLHEQKKTAAGEARIINLLDRKISEDPAGYAPYLLSKKMLAELTKLAALELAPAISVNGVAPGAVLPPVMLDGESAGGLRQDSTPEEVAAAVLSFLHSSDATGKILFLGGEE